LFWLKTKEGESGRVNQERREKEKPTGTSLILLSLRICLRPNLGPFRPEIGPQTNERGV
jgi:hypothetical protein